VPDEYEEGTSMTKVQFAGSTVGEPWWLAGEMVRDAIRSYGYEVEITDESASERNIPWVWGGKAQLGACVPEHFSQARAMRPEYEGARLDDLAAIATIIRPSWLGLAVRAETGITDLRQVKERRLPIKLFSPPAGPGTMVDAVLRYHGFTLEDLRSWGGEHYRWSGRRKESYVRDGVVNVFLGNIYHGYTPHGRFWYEATILYDIRFLDLEPQLIATLSKHHGYRPSQIPELLYRGVDREIPSVQQTELIIYCRRDAPDELVGTVARALDEHSEIFKTKRVPFYYERDQIGKNEYLPLHPAVEAYYRSRGYPVGAPARAKSAAR